MSGAICGAIIGGAIGFNNGAKGVRKANKKVIKAFNKQLAVINRQYSYAQNELDKQAVYERDNAQSEMYQLSLNALRNNSLVEASLGESGLEGRSQKAVARDVRGQSERQKDNIQSSYENAIYSIKSQKDSLHVEYSQNVQNLYDYYQAQITKGWKAFWQISDATAQGAAMGYFGGALGGSFLSGAAGGSTSAAAVGSSTSAAAGGSSVAASTVGSTAGSTGGSAASQWVNSELLSQFGSSASSSAGTSSALSTVGGSSWSWSAGWANVANNWGTYYNNMNKYMNYYNTFRQYVGTNNQSYGYGYQRRRGYYY